MNEDTQLSIYQQANSFAQDPLDETTSTSDLTTPIAKRPFKPIEQVYLKAFIKLTHQKSKAQHHHRTLEEALRLERLPRGLTPNIKHNIPKAPTSLIIKWNQSLFRTAKELTEILSTYWSEQIQEIDFEFEKLKAELESKTTLTQERWDNLHKILDNISASVSQELKCKKPKQDNMTQQ